MEKRNKENRTKGKTENGKFEERKNGQKRKNEKVWKYFLITKTGHCPLKRATNSQFLYVETYYFWG